MANIANRITIIRILLIPAFMAFLLSPLKYGDFVAVSIFVIAAATDGLDGYVARSKNMVTIFGKFLDPLADKLLISAALISLVELSLISSWIAMTIIAREFAVSGLRIMAIAEKRVIEASIWGKVKTVSQIVAVIFWIIFPNTHLANGSMALALFLTVFSGIDYFLKTRDIWLNEESERL